MPRDRSSSAIRLGWEVECPSYSSVCEMFFFVSTRVLWMVFRSRGFERPANTNPNRGRGGLGKEEEKLLLYSRQ